MHNYLVERTANGLVWATMINSPELPVNDEARNEAYCKHRCATLLAQKTKRETSDAS